MRDHGWQTVQVWTQYCNTWSRLYRLRLQMTSSIRIFRCSTVSGHWAKLEAASYLGLKYFHACNILHFSALSFSSHTENYFHHPLPVALWAQLFCSWLSFNLKHLQIFFYWCQLFLQSALKETMYFCALYKQKRVWHMQTNIHLH